MFNNFICFLYLTSFAFKGVYNFSNEINNTLEKGEVMPSFYKDDDKYYYNIASKTISNSIYKPYTYNINNGVYNLKDDLSVPQEITMKNFTSRINVIYSTFPNNFEFQESKFSYHIIEIEDITNGPFNPNRENREYYIFEYECGEYNYCLNQKKITCKYLKSYYSKGMSDEYINYSIEKYKDEFISYVESYLNQNVFVINSTANFCISDYIDLFEYQNYFTSSYEFVPLSNISSWYQCFIPNISEESAKIYDEYSFETFNDAKKVALDKYYEASTLNTNSYSSSNYDINGYSEELKYGNKKYKNIKLYDGYNSGESHDKDEFYLLRIPGSYSNPQAILKEWVPSGMTSESYLKDIINYYLDKNNQITYMDYFSNIEKRAKPYFKDTIYDDKTLFVDNLNIKTMKKLECNINFNYMHVDFKKVEKDELLYFSSYVNNNFITKYEKPGYYLIEEENYYNTTKFNPLLLVDKNKDNLFFDISNSSNFDINKYGNDIYVSMNDNEYINISFPYYDSHLIKIKDNENEETYFNIIDYENIENNNNYSFPKTKLKEGTYEILIANRFGVINKFNLNLSNKDISIDVLDADNDHFSIEINSISGGLKNISSYQIQRAFYPISEKSLVAYEELNVNPNYEFENVDYKSSFVKISSNDLGLYNIYTFYPKIDENGSFYQIINIYISDYYGKSVNKIYKWNYLKPISKIDVKFSSNIINLNEEINYLFIVDNQEYNLDSSEYKIETDNDLVEVNYQKQTIKGISLGKTNINFVFSDKYKSSNDIIFNLDIVNKEIKNEDNKQINLKYVFLIALGVLLVVLILMFIIKKRRKHENTK